jgi:hypothetical protein
MSTNVKIQNLRKLSVLMDSKFSGPFGFKFGLDGVLGLLPFVGDFISNVISLYIVFSGMQLGCTPSTVLRMGLNILIENVADFIPALGNIFDFFWKSNNKNIEIIESHLREPSAATNTSRLVLGLVAFTLLAITISSVALTAYVFKLLIEWFALFTS